MRSFVPNEPRRRRNERLLCRRQPSPTDREEFQMTTTNKDIIEQAYASFAAGDVPAALAAFADDIEWTEPDGYPIAGTYVGPQGVLEGVFMRLGEIGDHFSVVPEQFVGDGDTVVALGNLTWKHKDTGAPASVKMAHVWTLRDGKATTFQQHTDTARVRELS
jgi:uncharacterized protein